jgi:hypothetical protein
MKRLIVSSRLMVLQILCDLGMARMSIMISITDLKSTYSLGESN